MKKIPDILKIIGLKIVAIKGIPYSSKTKNVEPR